MGVMHPAPVIDVYKRQVAMSCAFCAVAEAQVPATLQPFVKVDAPVLVLENVRVIDGTGTGAEENQVIVIENGKITRVNKATAVILAQKFPQKLPALCDEFSAAAKPDTSAFDLAEAVASAQLSKQTKVDVLALSLIHI